MQNVPADWFQIWHWDGKIDHLQPLRITHEKRRLGNPNLRWLVEKP